jgi:hypothetical protein
MVWGRHVLLIFGMSLALWAVFGGAALVIWKVISGAAGV